MPLAPHHFISIPSSDGAFAEHVARIARRHAGETPAQIEARLRHLFPRVVVRERALSGERPAWYVYRDGGWLPSFLGAWWEAEGLPRLILSADGWISEANGTAAGLLAIDGVHATPWHFSDLVAPGTGADMTELLRAVRNGHELTATVVLRPASGEVIATDLHARPDGERTLIVLRLANDVAVAGPAVAVDPPDLTCLPSQDVAFRAYAELALARMPEPTPEGLALRLHRLYPHARVVADDGQWVANRDASAVEGAEQEWWLDPNLPRVVYDVEALIVDANDAARALLGRSLVGHHWQEFVTPGTTEQVSAMLAILAEVGAAESRFRMPTAEGSLIEFDSYTSVDGETFTTVMRKRGRPT